MFRSIRRRLLRRKPFPESWQSILDSRVPYYRHLPGPLKNGLREHLRVIMDEKIFEGCGGLIMTEEKKVIIAAYAVILILGDPSGYYPLLNAILVYPDDYIAPVHEEDESGIITEGTETRSGESWGMGSIVLSWSDIEQDLSQPFTGRNLMFHEFSHQLDDWYGVTEGIDEEGKVHTPNEWSYVLARAYRSLRKAVRRKEPALLDSYGASLPAEFFSVATECFFENPHPMREQLPELYGMLAKLYRMDPVSWFPENLQ